MSLSLSEGFHNSHSKERLTKGRVYRDLSTICVIPTRGSIPSRVVESFMGLMTPMNHKFARLFISNMEVGDAYNMAIETILAHPEISQWKYVLTLEEDNMPPPDGLLRLYESIEQYAAVGGLYWTKGEEGQPMIYGDPNQIMMFNPQLPQPDTVQECNGLGMGFTLFKMDTFREMDKPWFKTVQEWSPEKGAQMVSQDLYFFGNLRRAGHKVACDTKVKVGHYDKERDMVW